MKAIQYTAFGTRPKLVEVDKPSPGPGEGLLRITESGLCHSDEFVMMAAGRVEAHAACRYAATAVTRPGHRSACR